MRTVQFVSSPVFGYMGNTWSRWLKPGPLHWKQTDTKVKRQRIHFRTRVTEGVWMNFVSVTEASFSVFWFLFSLRWPWSPWCHDCNSFPIVLHSGKTLCVERSCHPRVCNPKWTRQREQRNHEKNLSACHNVTMCHDVAQMGAPFPIT